MLSTFDELLALEVGRTTLKMATFAVVEFYYVVKSFLFKPD